MRGVDQRSPGAISLLSMGQHHHHDAFPLRERALQKYSPLIGRNRKRERSVSSQLVSLSELGPRVVQFKNTLIERKKRTKT